MKDYIEKALRTESQDWEMIKARMSNINVLRLDHAADGLCTEAGEFKDTLKKWKYYGKPLDYTNLMEELGDMLWYVAIACKALGIDFEYLQLTNIAKLKERYPDKFDGSKATDRDIEKELSVFNNE